MSLKLKRPTLHARKAKPVKLPTVDSLVQAPLSMDGIRRNIARHADGTYVWFRLGRVRKSFLGFDEWETLESSQQHRWAELVGHRVHVRRTSHRFASELWAEDLDMRTKNPLETPEGVDDWYDVLGAAERRVQQMRAHTSACYVGVRFTAKRLTDDQLARLAQVVGTNSHDPATSKLRDKIDKVSSIIRAEGFNGKPVTSRVIALLLQSSLGMGTPVDPRLLAGAEEWGAGDFAGFTGSVLQTADAGASTVQVQSLRGGQTYTAHVGVLTLEKIGPRPREARGSMVPWLTGGDHMDFEVEWSCRFDIKSGDELKHSAEVTQTRAESLDEHYREHGHRPPLAVERTIGRAEEIVDEVTTGSTEDGVRLVGTIHAAIPGDTPEQVQERIGELQREYAKYQDAALVQTYAQHALLRQFCPGEPRTIAGFDHFIPAYFMAKAVPNAATHVGDRQGPYLGMAGRSMVAFDPVWGPMHDKSGMCFIGGTLRAGKSTVAGLLVWNALRRNIPCLINDPSGALKKLVGLPELAGIAQHVELSSAAPGTLVPHALVVVPDRADFNDPKEYTEAIREAEAERIDLLIDAFAGLLPPSMTNEPGIDSIIELAVTEAGGDYGLNPWVVVKAMQKAGGLSQKVGDFLERISTTKGVALIFPEDRDTRIIDPQTSIGNKLLTVITMAGIRPGDPKIDRKYWTRTQRTAVPVLHLASCFAMRFMHANKRPKLIINDEVGISGAGESAYQAFLLRGNRDSGKTNTFFAILGQNPVDMSSLSEQVANLLGCVFLGRMPSKEAAAAGLELADLPVGIGYEKALQQFPPGTFLLRDYEGNAEIVDVDIEWVHHVKEALDTTPPGAVEDEESSDWIRDLERELVM